MMAYKGISLEDVFLLSLHLIPPTLTIATAWGFAIALVWVYQRWKQENAFDVMFSCGMSPWFFNQVAVLLALIVTALLYGATLYFTPIAQDISRRHEQAVKERFDPSFITSGVFFTIQDRLLYAHKHPSRYRLEGIFLHDHTNPKNEFILLGQAADITPHGQGFSLRFHNGSMHLFSKTRPPSLTHFKSYTLYYQRPNGKKTPKKEFQKINEQSLNTLWRMYQSLEHTTALGCVKKELSYRLLWPMTPLIDALWVPWILLADVTLAWPLCLCALILHVGMLSSWSFLALACGIVIRGYAWYVARRYR